MRQAARTQEQTPSCSRSTVSCPRTIKRDTRAILKRTSRAIIHNSLKGDFFYLSKKIVCAILILKKFIVKTTLQL